MPLYFNWIQFNVHHTLVNDNYVILLRNLKMVFSFYIKNEILYTQYCALINKEIGKDFYLNRFMNKFIKLDYCSSLTK